MSLQLEIWLALAPGFSIWKFPKLVVKLSSDSGTKSAWIIVLFTAIKNKYLQTQGKLKIRPLQIEKVVIKIVNTHFLTLRAMSTNWVSEHWATHYTAYRCRRHNWISMYYCAAVAKQTVFVYFAQKKKFSPKCVRKRGLNLKFRLNKDAPLLE